MLALHPTTTRNLDYVLALERDGENAPFIERWPRERHERAIADADESHLLVVDGDDPAGFVILAGLGGAHRSIELTRIVIDAKGRGLGQQALRLTLEHAFGDLGAHRVWLDVMTFNERARAAYRKVGFVEEGVLREAFLTDGRYESLVVMSVLEDEWSG